MSSSFDRRTDDLFQEYAKTRDRRTRDTLVALYQPLVSFLAGKFAGRGEPLEDLLQVGNVGLLNAVERFEPTSGHRFATYATPTIVGEIRRHFRDRAWSIKVPRRLQELNQAASRIADVLAAELGRSPTYAEIAAAIGATEEETLAAVELSTAYETLSIDAHVSVDGDADPLTVAEFVGEEDVTLVRLQKYGDLTAALSTLTERERDVIALRFFRDLSQAEVAHRLGISQMHVSRLQARALDQLRRRLSEVTDSR